MNIQIEQYDESGFTVTNGDEYTDHLTWDEMLGLVAQVTMPDTRRCLQWLKTQEQWDRHNAARQRRLAELTLGDDK